MEWYNILVLIVGALGGTAGIISIYHAKSNKDTIDIKNMQEMLDEAHKMYNEMNEIRQTETEAFKKYKEDTMKYIEEFKMRFKKLEDRLSESEEVVLKLRSSIYSCYRCTLPSKIDECPVLVAFRTFFGSDKDSEQ
jgi:hypothetical protein